MARGEMLVVMSYDVGASRARRKLAALLEAELTRVQKSVFEGRLTAARTEALRRRAAALLEPGDSLRVYSVGADGLRRSAVEGTGAPLQEAADFWVI